MTSPQVRPSCGRGHFHKRASREDRRPLRHLQGVLRLGNTQAHSAHADGRVLPSRRRRLSGESAIGSCRSSQPSPLPTGSCHRQLPVALRTQGATQAVSFCNAVGQPRSHSSHPLRSTSSRTTARVRRPSLSILPHIHRHRFHAALPTALEERRRPYNPRLQQTVTRLLMGASRPQARACS